MPRGPQRNPPIFDLETALQIRERFLAGETYKAIAEEMGETASRVSHCLHRYGVISKEDVNVHYKAIMSQRRERGVRVGRKPKQTKKAGS